MTRILIGTSIALLLALALAGWQIDRAAEQRQQLEQSLAAISEANAANARAVDTLELDINERDRITLEIRRRQTESDRLAAAANTQLERMKRENRTLTDYLDSIIPAPAADWMWLPSASGADGYGLPDSSAGADRTHPETGQPIPAVSHETGWKWCRGVERALDSCNADKAAIREHQQSIMGAERTEKGIDP